MDTLRLRDYPVASQLPVKKGCESYNPRWLELEPRLSKGVLCVFIKLEAMIKPPIILSIGNTPFLAKAAIEIPCPLFYEPITLVNTFENRTF